MKLTKRSSLPATLLLICVTGVWGFTFVLNQQILTEVTLTDLQTWRFGIASLLMISLRPHWLLAAPKIHYVHGFWLGLALSAGYVMQLIGLQRTSATASGFITGMFVVLVPLLGGLIFKQRIPKVAWIATGMTTVGLALIAFNGITVGFGEVITVGCAALFALHIIGLDKWSDPEYVYSLTTTQIIAVFITSLISSLVSGGIQAPTNNQTWINIAFLAVVATCIGYFAQTWVQSQLSSTRTAIILTMEPVFAMVAGITIGSDSLTLRMIVGAMLILIATYVVELGPRASAEGTHPHLEP